MILNQHGIAGLPSGGGDFVEIGGRMYRTVKIGSQTWLAENLDYKFDVNGSQIPIGQSGAPTTPAAWYYNNDESTYGIDGTRKCGLLYNWYAAKYLDDNKSTLLPNGWHVPSFAEWMVLKSSAGSEGGRKLKASDISWAMNWGGTDDFEFSIMPAGYRESNFINAGSITRLWSVTNQSSVATAVVFNTNVYMDYYDGYPKTAGYSIRLVRTPNIRQVTI